MITIFDKPKAFGVENFLYHCIFIYNMANRLKLKEQGREFLLCKTCKLQKPLTNFMSGKYIYKCKQCCSEIVKEYQKNITPIQRKRRNKFKRLNYHKNKQPYLPKLLIINCGLCQRKLTITPKSHKRKYCEKCSKELERKRMRVYFQKNKKSLMKKRLIKEKEDFRYRLRKNISTYLRRYLKKGHMKKTKYFKEILGCSVEELREYLESLFKEGMTWENYGRFGWHIDHIIPICSAKTEEEVYKLFHYTNLQPLWWRENLVKGGKYE